MIPATQRRHWRDAQVTLVNGQLREWGSMASLPAWLLAGDVVVVNDAATLPASLRGQSYELRLYAQVGNEWDAFLLGPGDWRMRTEDRSASLEHVLRFGRLEATVVRRVSERLVRVRFNLQGAAFWHALYQQGAPVQYAHTRRDFALWDVQTAYAGSPLAAEMPSAGWALSIETILALRKKGVHVVSLTHAAGLSSSGEAALDSSLPLAEAYTIPPLPSGRVIAVGTSVVRALETAAAGEGVTQLKIGPGHRLQRVDAILTGWHEPETSHYALLQAFAPRAVLDAAYEEAQRRGALGHELGDLALIFSDARNDSVAVATAA